MKRWRIIILLAALLIWPATAAGSNALPSSAPAPTTDAGTPHTIHVVSGLDLPWIDGLGHHGITVYSAGHNGCNSVDGNGYCVGGAWPHVGSGHWIWAANPLQSGIVVTQTFFLPDNATPQDSSIDITGDDEYQLWFNGQSIGHNDDWTTIKHYTLTPQPGPNVLVARVNNWRTFAYKNPGGIIWDATIHYTAP